MSMSVEAANSDEGHDCPTCGETFPSESGMKSHHKQAHGTSIRGSEVECANCGNSFRRGPSDIKRNERHFCDKSCQEEWWEKTSSVETVECAGCGADLQRPPNRLSRNDHHFCDPECHGGWKSENLSGENAHQWSRVETECAYCSAALQVQPSKLEATERVFCDWDCRGAWQSEVLTGSRNPHYNRVEVSCETCGASVDRRPCEVENVEHHFCDHECYGEWISGENHPRWMGGDELYGEGWNEEKKERVRERDGGECQHPGCGMTGAEHRDRYGGRLHVHHIVKARQFDDPAERNAEGNLITLCAPHHRTWEQLAPLRPDAA